MLFNLCSDQEKLTSDQSRSSPTADDQGSVLDDVVRNQMCLTLASSEGSSAGGEVAMGDVKVRKEDSFSQSKMENYSVNSI